MSVICPKRFRLHESLPSAAPRPVFWGAEKRRVSRNTVFFRDSAPQSRAGTFSFREKKAPLTYLFLRIRLTLHNQSARSYNCRPWQA